VYTKQKCQMQRLWPNWTPPESLFPTQANAVSEILQVEHVQFRDKITTTLTVNDKEVKFEIDSGAAVSLMSESLAHKLFPNSSIYVTDLTLVLYCRD